MLWARAMRSRMLKLAVAALLDPRARADGTYHDRMWRAALTRRLAYMLRTHWCLLYSVDRGDNSAQRLQEPKVRAATRNSYFKPFICVVMSPIGCKCSCQSNRTQSRPAQGQHTGTSTVPSTNLYRQPRHAKQKKPTAAGDRQSIGRQPGLAAHRYCDGHDAEGW
jgi:hypothetical protein